MELLIEQKKYKIMVNCNLYNGKSHFNDSNFLCSDDNIEVLISFMAAHPAWVSLELGGRAPEDIGTDGTRPNPGPVGPLLYRYPTGGSF